MNIEKTVGWKALIFKDQGFQTVDKAPSCEGAFLVS